MYGITIANGAGNQTLTIYDRVYHHAARFYYANYAPALGAYFSIPFSVPGCIDDGKWIAIAGVPPEFGAGYGVDQIPRAVIGTDVVYVGFRARTSNYSSGTRYKIAFVLDIWKD